jgi:UrcA family protein
MRLRPTQFAIPCMALIIFLSPFAGASTVLRPGYEPVTRIVNFADLDLTNTRAVAILYQRIKSAADQVCEPPAGAGSFETVQEIRRCKKQAVAQAVKDVSSSALMNFHVAAISQTDFQ